MPSNRPPHITFLEMPRVFELRVTDEVDLGSATLVEDRSACVVQTISHRAFWLAHTQHSCLSWESPNAVVVRRIEIDQLLCSTLDS
jgi:hypothetical protein